MLQYVAVASVAICSAAHLARVKSPEGLKSSQVICFRITVVDVEVIDSVEVGTVVAGFFRITVVDVEVIGVAEARLDGTGSLMATLDVAALVVVDFDSCAVSSVLHAAFAAHKADALDKQFVSTSCAFFKEYAAYAGSSSHDNCLAVVMFGRMSQTRNGAVGFVLAHAACAE